MSFSNTGEKERFPAAFTLQMQARNTGFRPMYSNNGPGSNQKKEGMGAGGDHLVGARFLHLS